MYKEFLIYMVVPHTRRTTMARLENSYAVGVGLQPTLPPPVIATAAPGSTNIKFPLGQVWLDINNGTSYILNNINSGSATWNLMSPGASDVDTLTGDSGGAISPSSGNITIAGGTNITSAGAGSTITLNLDAAITLGTSVTAPAIVGSTSVTSGGDVIMSAAATKIQMNGGAVTDFIGQATLVSGTVTIANTNIAANDRIFLTRADENSSSALGELTITALTASTSFVITALDPSDGSTTITGDVSVVNYVIMRQT